MPRSIVRRFHWVSVEGVFQARAREFVKQRVEDPAGFLIDLIMNGAARDTGTTAVRGLRRPRVNVVEPSSALTPGHSDVSQIPATW